MFYILSIWSELVFWLNKMLQHSKCFCWRNHIRWRFFISELILKTQRKHARFNEKESHTKLVTLRDVCFEVLHALRQHTQKNSMNKKDMAAQKPHMIHSPHEKKEKEKFDAITSENFSFSWFRYRINPAQSLRTWINDVCTLFYF